jgi:hypothetical protein
MAQQRNRLIRKGHIVVPDGWSPRKTSDGTPHLIIHIPDG